MKRLTKPNLWPLAAATCALAMLSPGVVEAGTTIGFGSSVGATNLTSSGLELNESFVFQLGTFEAGFEPAADNTDLWLAAWREASDVEGDPLEGNSAPYQTQELPAPFPPGMRANNFTSSVTLDHNEPPFDLGGQLYIWGYNRRAVPGAAEWILISDPSWKWPDGSSNLPATSYAVSGATVTVLGEIRGDGFEMKTAEVTVPGSSANLYEGWLAANFSEALLSDPSLEAGIWGGHADPDNDRLTNLMEYFIAGDPNVSATTDVLGQLEISGDEVSVEFRQSRSASGVIGQVEWSEDLQNWSRENIEQSVVSEDGTHATMRVNLPLGEAQQVYFRLTVRRAP